MEEYNMGDSISHSIKSKQCFLGIIFS